VNTKRKKKRGPGRPKEPGAKRRHLPAARCTSRELRAIQELADRHAGGSLSRWLVYAALNAPRPPEQGGRSDSRGAAR